MDYGLLIRRAWNLTQQHRFLWVLGLFATGTVGSCSPMGGGGSTVQWRVGPGEAGWFAPSVARGLRQAAPFLRENVDLVLALVAVAAFLGLVFLVLSLLTQGGMARATADLALGRPIAAGQAWGAGLRLFWRYLGLWLLLILLTLAVGAVVAGMVALTFGLAQVTSGVLQAVLVAIVGFLALVVFVAALLIIVGIGVAVTYAQRAIAVEDVGPLGGLRAGYRLLRTNPGDSALAWLINLGLGIAAALAVALGVLLLLVTLGAVAVVLFVVLGVSVVPIIYAVAAVVALIVWGWLLAAIANSFFWSYWTLVYLRFSGLLTDRLELPPPEPGGQT